MYGSGSIAGTVRVIPKSPNLEQVEGKLATRYSQTGEQGDDNTMVQAALNVPLIEDSLAVRAVAYQFENSGFIENVAVSQPVPGLAATQGFGGVASDRGDVGNDKYTGFRVTTLWKPTEPMDITLGYMHQKIEQDGMPEVNLDLSGDYQQRRFNTGVEGGGFEFLENEIDIVNLVVNYETSIGSFTNSASWITYEDAIESDFTHVTFLFGLADQPFFSDNEAETERFSEELRFTSDLDGAMQFIAGLYYEDDELVRNATLPWSGTAPGVIPTLSVIDTVQTTEQWAFFGEISYTINDQLSATVGMRHFDYEKELVQTVFGTALPPSVKDEDGQTYRVNLSYTPQEDMLVYGQWAEGFRLGTGDRVNPNCQAAGLPSGDGVDSDNSQNYELGLKTTLADNRVTFNAAVYRIDWDGIPVRVNFGSGCVVEVGAGKATSEGIELELNAHLSESLLINLSTSYGEMTFAETSSIGSKGENLPGSADFNISTGLQYDFTLGDYDSFARIDYSYISEYYNSPAETGQAAGGFGQLNLKAGIAIDQLELDLFVNNLANDEGITWVDSINSGLGVNRANRIRPRTVGMNLSYQF